MAGVTSVGVGSGLDLESLLTKLVNAERAPTEARLARQEADIQLHVSAFGNLKSALSRLQAGLAGLNDASSLGAPSATASDATLFSASAASGADLGQYAIQVLNLAGAHKLASADFADGGAVVGSGTLTVANAGGSFDVEVAAGTTLLELRDLINNAAGNDDVTASLLTVDDGGGGTVTKLVLTARNTGADSAISISVADDDANNTDNLGLSRFFFAAGNAASQLDEITQARDARIAVDGFTASSSTNTFSGVIDDVTITALREPEDPLDPESATLTVARSTAALTSRIQAFIGAYNEARATLRDLTRYNAETGEAGPLLGDSTALNIDTILRRILASTVEGPDTYNSLASIGIVSQRDGSLAVNGSKLTAALNNGFADVVQLFSNENGVASRFAKALDGALLASGSIRARTDGYDKQLRDIENQRETLDLRVAEIESRYRQQFIALDQLVSRLQSSGDFLLQQLANTNKIILGDRGNN